MKSYKKKQLLSELKLGRKIDMLEKKYLEGKPNTPSTRASAYRYAHNRLQSGICLGIKKANKK